MKTLMTLLLTVLATHAVAAVDCTKEPKDKWKNQDAFKKELEATYKIKNFKVTAGNCYEIYGWNKAGKKVEIYFNPVNGSIVKERIEK